ncbi:MAG: thioredoxin domain-containing protein [Phormidesmis sp.]
MTFNQPVRGQRAVAKGLAVGLVVGAIALSLIGCSGGSPTTDQAQQIDPVEPANSEPANSEPATSDQAAAEAEQSARAEYEAQMKQIASVLDGMDRAELIGNSPTKGPADAAVVLLKFSDFQCPYCAIAAADMKTFTERHTSDVLYVYKQFPLVSIHPEAMPAAKAAWAAGQQDQFWIYHDGLFAYQDKLGEDYYTELAEQIGLDMAQFERDRNSPEAQAAVEQDVALARDLGLRGTPTFLMNELLIPGGTPLELFDEAVVRLKAADAQAN